MSSELRIRLKISCVQPFLRGLINNKKRILVQINSRKSRIIIIWIVSQVLEFFFIDYTLSMIQSNYSELEKKEKWKQKVIGEVWQF